MKKKLSLIAIVVVAVCAVAASPVRDNSVIMPYKGNVVLQQNPDFAFFRTHRQGRNGITSTWGMTSENGVVYFSLLRTYEDPGEPLGWAEVGTIPASSSRSYKWTNENVGAGFISYRVVAHMSDGSTITTWVNTIRIVRH